VIHGSLIIGVVFWIVSAFTRRNIGSDYALPLVALWCFSFATCVLFFETLGYIAWNQGLYIRHLITQTRRPVTIDINDYRKMRKEHPYMCAVLYIFPLIVIADLVIQRVR
jgi:hypothetical protein